jgi:hypothetical protein
MAKPVLSSSVCISISWHRVAYSFYTAVRCASEMSTRIRQAIPSRKKVISRSERQFSTEVTTHIAGSLGVRRTASAKSLFLLLRGSNQVLHGPRHFQGTRKGNGVGKK